MQDDSDLLQAKASALREAGLSVSDPRDQENLVERVPNGVEPLGILNSYEFREEKVRCAVCDKKTPHNIGITLSLPNGKKALCGSDCAEVLYGREVWIRMERDFKARERDVVLKMVVASMAPLLKETRKLASPWFGAAKAIRDFIEEFHEIAPAFLETLRDRVSRHDGHLEDTNGKLVWTIRGGACLLDDPAKCLNDLGEIIREAEGLLQKKSDKTEDLERLSQIKGDLRTGLYHVAGILFSARQFIASENLSKIAKWAGNGAKNGRRHRVTTAADGQAVYEIETGKDVFGDVQAWEIIIPIWPPTLDIPSREEISSLFN